MRRNRWKRAIPAFLFLLLSALMISLLSAALRPARVDYGAVWGPYLAEPEDSLDYLYLGSSYASCDVDPAAVYSASGLTGYVLAGPEQTLSQTYWYLREALKTQTPGAVILELSALEFARYQNYTQVNVGYMPFGINKLGAIFTASEPELRTGLLFDLYFYHGRWKDVTLGEIAGALRPAGTDNLKGFTPVDGVFEAISSGPFTRERQPQQVLRENLEDLRRISDLCAEKNVPLLTVLHPTYSQIAPEARAQIQAAAAAADISFLDWSDDLGSAGLVPELHFYDPGHLNQAGAARFSTWLGTFLREELGLVPRPQSAENTAAWQEVVQSRQVTKAPPA